MERKSGVLLHISSLPGKQGIGTMGQEARKFVDFLVSSHQTYWQILPLNQTSFGDSPYQSFSSFAGNPYFIDLDYLAKDGLLKRSDYQNINWKAKENSINYGELYVKRYPVLRKAVKNISKSKLNNKYRKFVKENKWLNDYSLFMAIKENFNNVALQDWPIKYKIKDPKTIREFIKKNYDEIEFFKGVQFLFYKQWFDLKKYANKKGIYIIGDCPIYVAADSVDVWSNPELFRVKQNLIPTKVAGCPPDGFSKDGQLWGNPLYNWPMHKKENYKWWANRVGILLNLYDKLRIDHFRGLSSYYCIDYGSKNARHGKWIKGPGKEIVDAINKRVGKDSIIAEDLGFISDDVRELLKYSDYPGMAVLEFAFDTRDSNGNDNLPSNMKKNQIAYIGTHDNETIMGWINTIPKKQLKYTMDYLGTTNTKQFNWKMIRMLSSCVPDLVIFQGQDLLGLDNKARMNVPSTIGNNWKWRAKKNAFNSDISKKLREITDLYKRS